MPANGPSPLLSEAPGAPWWLEAEREKGPAGEGPLPGNWPPLDVIEYVSKLLILIILLLAFPWLIAKALTEPRALSGHAGGLSMGAASMGA